ncbi:hypothetical protein HMPREF3291_02410 [Bacillus sp. HMSC76G11]|nr:hypothetical protein HMPREF3291_02410 [Bacillus sp. HMSC76G11]
MRQAGAVQKVCFRIIIVFDYKCCPFLSAAIHLKFLAWSLKTTKFMKRAAEKSRQEITFVFPACFILETY